jgi:putative nucleotidyltransferase with HDIG domain
MRRLLYRLRQFGRYAAARPGPADRQCVADRLGPALAALFAQMTPAEQAHSIRVARALQAAGCAEPDLIVAALLHDVGKAGRPLALWERTLVVLLGKFTPRLAARLGRSPHPPRGLRRPFVIARRHPEWGAALCEQAGAPQRVVALVRHHQSEPAQAEPDIPRSSEAARWLAALQQADEES